METIHYIKIVISMKNDYLNWIFNYLKKQDIKPRSISPEVLFLLMENC